MLVSCPQWAPADPPPLPPPPVTWGAYSWAGNHPHTRGEKSGEAKKPRTPPARIRVGGAPRTRPRLHAPDRTATQRGRAHSGHSCRSPRSWALAQGRTCPKWTPAPHTWGRTLPRVPPFALHAAISRKNTGYPASGPRRPAAARRALPILPAPARAGSRQDVRSAAQHHSFKSIPRKHRLCTPTKARNRR